MSTVALAVLASPAQAASVSVTGCSGLQSALDAASDGDVVTIAEGLVCHGGYTLRSGTSITLQGAGGGHARRRHRRGPRRHDPRRLQRRTHGHPQPHLPQRRQRREQRRRDQPRRRQPGEHRGQPLPGQHGGLRQRRGRVHRRLPVVLRRAARACARREHARRRAAGQRLRRPRRRAAQRGRPRRRRGLHPGVRPGHAGGQHVHRQRRRGPRRRRVLHRVQRPRRQRQHLPRQSSRRPPRHAGVRQRRPLRRRARARRLPPGDPHPCGPRAGGVRGSAAPAVGQRLRRQCHRGHDRRRLRRRRVGAEPPGSLGGRPLHAQHGRGEADDRRGRRRGGRRPLGQLLPVRLRAFEGRNLVAAGNAFDTGGEGGGIYVGAPQGALLTLLDSTVAGNTTQSAGGISGGPADHLELRNAIVPVNKGDGQLGGFAAGGVDAASSLLCGPGVPADGSRDTHANFCADPLLVDPRGGEVHETANSPSRNTGDDSLVPADLAKDYEGDARIGEGRVDIGADEYVATTKPAPPAAASTPAPAQGISPVTIRRCVSRRGFRIRLRVPHGQKGSGAVVHVVSSKVRVTVRHKRLTAPVVLRGLPKGTFSVKIRIHLANGRTIAGTRIYHTCTIKRTGSIPTV